MLGTSEFLKTFDVSQHINVCTLYKYWFNFYVHFRAHL